MTAVASFRWSVLWISLLGVLFVVPVDAQDVLTWVSLKPLRACSYSEFKWSGGTGPYQIQLLDGLGSTLETLESSWYLDSYLWRVNYAPGWKVQFRITDSVRLVTYSNDEVVGSGSSQDCVMTPFNGERPSNNTSPTAIMSAADIPRPTFTDLDGLTYTDGPIPGDVRGWDYYSGSSALSAAAIAGIVVGGVLFLSFIGCGIGLCIFFSRRRKRNEAASLAAASQNGQMGGSGYQYGVAGQSQYGVAGQPQMMYTMGPNGQYVPVMNYQNGQYPNQQMYGVQDNVTGNRSLTADGTGNAVSTPGVDSPSTPFTKDSSTSLVHTNPTDTQTPATGGFQTYQLSSTQTTGATTDSEGYQTYHVPSATNAPNPAYDVGPPVPPRT